MDVTINRIDNTKVSLKKLFFMQTQNRKSVENKFKIYSVDADDVILNDLHKITKNKIEQLANKPKNEFVNFMEHDTIMSDKIYCITPNLVEGFNYIIEQIKNIALPQFVVNKKLPINIHIFVIEKEAGRLVCFTYNPKTYIQTKKKFWTFYKDRLMKVDNVLIIRNNIDCIYDEYNKTIFIFNVKNFERIFNYRQFYHTKTKEALVNLEKSKIILANNIKEKLNDSKRLQRKITSLVYKNKLKNINIESIKEHKELLPNLKFEITNDEIKIGSIDALKDLLDVIDDNYVKGIVSGQSYKSEVKQPIFDSNKING